MVSDLDLRLVNLWLVSSLNPCCSGRWSLTVTERVRNGHYYIVLILVVVEDGL